MIQIHYNLRIPTFIPNQFEIAFGILVNVNIVLSKHFTILRVHVEINIEIIIILATERVSL